MKYNKAKGREMKVNQIRKGKGKTKVIKWKRSDRISKYDMRNIRTKNERK
jgi:hypothetical protein